MNVETILKNRAGKVEEWLEKLFPADDSIPARLREGMRYSLFAGGKRIRPVLTVLAYEACGGEREGEVYPAACAFEMVHTYSLIHDDLPAMDDDDLRRGRPTLHRKFDEATAILAGDALLTGSFELIARETSKDRVAAVVLELAAGAGAAGMIGGQMADILGETREGTPERVEYIHRCKTAALIRGAVRTGGILARGDGDRMEGLTRYGEAAGLAFQIADDLLDLNSTSEKMGKPTGRDSEHGKITWPGVFGEKRARADANRLAGEAKEAALSLGEKGAPLAALAEYIVKRLH